MTMPAAFGSQPAPPFPEGTEWLNAGRDLVWDDLRGRLVILHFWTYA